MSAPLIARDGGREWVMCSTPGCGRKKLAEIEPGTAMQRGAVIVMCPRCKETYRIELETLPAAA